MSVLNLETGAVPAFVFRGLSTRTDPANIETTRYSSEADLRDSLAAHWWLHGWDVRTEVRIPDCGRVDVLAEVGDVQVVIELKREITTPTAARQAYQQAHAYEAYLRHVGESHTLVTAALFSWSAAEAAERAFGGIWGDAYLNVASLAVGGALGVNRTTVSRLVSKARVRRLSIEALLSAVRAAECATALAAEPTFADTA